MASTAQVVATVPVFDYLYDPTSGKAMPNQEVVVQLEFNKATAIAPVVSLPNAPIRVTTDPNGYWQVSVVPNTNINPANTVYSVRAGGQSFQVSVPAGPGPYQASAIATTIPPAMVPAGPFTAGSVLFAGVGGAATQDNGNLFWDATSHHLGIGTASPADLLTLIQPAGTPPVISLTSIGAPKAIIGVSGGSGQLTPGSLVGDLVLRVLGQSILLSTDGGVSTALGLTGGLLSILQAAATTTGLALNGGSTLRSGTGVPSNAIGADGDFFFRKDGGAGSCVYQRAAGAYVARA